MEIFNEKVERPANDIVFSQTIKAGKKVYYLDVKKNRNSELFLSITESRKLNSTDEWNSAPRFEKHKIHLYKEDFEKFTTSMHEVMNYIKENNTVDFVPKKTEEIELS